VEEYFSKLKAGIEAFENKGKGEIYLLACFDEDRWAFEIMPIRT